MDERTCMSDCATTPERLNAECFCVSLDRAALSNALRTRLREHGLDGGAIAADKRFFADVPVFVRRADIAAMEEVARAIDAVTRLPAYADRVARSALPIALFAPGPRGVFMGYDFHVGADGPRLIEVNTNAGGALLNVELARAQRLCCAEIERAFHTLGELERFDEAVVRMFEAEWRLQRGDGRPERIAIVDDRPETQHLYPEFRLMQEFLETHGIEAVVADPHDLVFAGRELRALGKRIDLVYNRLVDFMLDAPEHAALRAAYLDGAVVVTPNPRAHALFADKRNLVLLCDVDALTKLGVAESDARLIAAAVPRTVAVTAENVDELWQSRRELFFKPAASHGSKGVYRGSKITRRAFGEVAEGGYVAQRYVAPSERLVNVDGERIALKLDVRLYTYGGDVLLTAARIYRGQATNMRTPGGGFAPVFQL